MGYREDPPPPGWGGLAECVWTAPASGGTVTVLPDGCMDLFWSGTEVVVAGPDTRAHHYVRTPGVATAGLRFHPGVLPALLGTPAAALRDRRVALDALLPVPGRVVAALAAGAPPGPALAATVSGAAPSPALRAVAAYLARGASAAETADALGWTTRTLHRHCLAAFGYGPATLRRVLRFRRAVGLLGAGVGPADAAARAGYADQPHLSREVRAFAGASPGRLATPRSADPG